MPIPIIYMIYTVYRIYKKNSSCFLFLFLLLPLLFHATFFCKTNASRTQIIRQAFYKANNLLANKKYAQAIKLYKKIVDIQPNMQQVYFNLAYAYKIIKNYPEAITYFYKVIELDPNNQKSYSMLGSIYTETNKPELAIKNLLKAIELNPNDENAHVRLNTIYIRQQAYEKAEIHLKQIIHNFPKSVIIIYNLAYTLKMQGKMHEAIPYYLKTLEINPEFGMANLGIAKAYLATGQLKKGWSYFEWRFRDYKEIRESSNHHTLTPFDLIKKTILLKQEWGLGDMMQFIRYAKLLKELGATVLVYIHKPLRKLFSLCPYIDMLVQPGDPIPKIDYKIPIMSLPLIFGTTLETIPANIPYLYADEKLVSFWHKKISQTTPTTPTIPNKNFKVGICWHAKPIFLEENYLTRRSISLQAFEPLAHIKNISLYSLQKIYGLEELNNLPKDFNIVTFGPDFDETHGRFMDTAALITNLDLIITADTSIVHLAGALGKPVWILLPYVAEWRWLQQGEKSAWYPKARLFRQKEPAQWIPVIKEVKQELEKYITKTQKTREQYDT